MSDHPSSTAQLRSHRPSVLATAGGLLLFGSLFILLPFKDIPLTGDDWLALAVAALFILIAVFSLIHGIRYPYTLTADAEGIRYQLPWKPEGYVGWHEIEGITLTTALHIPNIHLHCKDGRCIAIPFNDRSKADHKRLDDFLAIAHAHNAPITAK